MYFYPKLPLHNQPVTLRYPVKCNGVEGNGVVIFKQFAGYIQEGMGNNIKFMLHCDNTLYNSHINIAIYFKFVALIIFKPNGVEF